MAKGYFELRKQSARGTDSMAADIMRHLHARQHIGKAVIICDNPVAFYSACRKQWLKLARTIQKLRAATLNADKILKHTHTITHMQHMRFTHKDPLAEPDADIYFVRPDNCEIAPLHCYTIYAMEQLPVSSWGTLLEQLPPESLVVDYRHSHDWPSLGLQPKAVLEQQVRSEWRQVHQFLASKHINAATLIYKDMHDIEAMDDALDTLLGVSHQFMRVAHEFQRALELARPLRLSREVREQYDALVLLAHRVQALSPGAFTQHFLEAYNEDDTFFLYDSAKTIYIRSNEPLADVLRQHLAAGRRHLAHALQIQAAYNGRSFSPKKYPMTVETT